MRVTTFNNGTSEITPKLFDLRARMIYQQIPVTSASFIKLQKMHVTTFNNGPSEITPKLLYLQARILIYQQIPHTSGSVYSL